MTFPIHGHACLLRTDSCLGHVYVPIAFVPFGTRPLNAVYSNDISDNVLPLPCQHLSSVFAFHYNSRMWVDAEHLKSPLGSFGVFDINMYSVLDCYGICIMNQHSSSCEINFGWINSWSNFQSNSCHRLNSQVILVIMLLNTNHLCSDRRFPCHCPHRTLTC